MTAITRHHIGWRLHFAGVATPNFTTETAVSSHIPFLRYSATFAQGDSVEFFGIALPEGVFYGTTYTITKISTPGLFSIAGLHQLLILQPETRNKYTAADGTPVKPPASSMSFTARVVGEL